ncbi:hypothetical protein [Halomonas lysinitropha]|uniref:Uncharacterized protein n=1 Tax=Halomonas lysinitropha TaxID=2607506 RepID=A0A5K1I927_9GAMM|nr:hypothetical protein [Halomonas lysinitropha]VVZ96480.1 hypothetical protein HALO32_02580 [Halomonas lysinitropha]
MAKPIDYDERWYQLLDKAAGGNRSDLDDMPAQKAETAIMSAFRRYLLAHYCDQVKNELGPALRPEKDADALRMRVMALHHWKFSEVEKLNSSALIAALNEQLAHLTLPPEAIQTVENLMDRRPNLKAALDHHRSQEPGVR